MYEAQEVRNSTTWEYQIYKKKPCESGAFFFHIYLSAHNTYGDLNQIQWIYC